MTRTFVALILAASCSTAFAQAPASFDARVSEARRSMRASCQALQKLPAAPASEKAGLEKSAGEGVATAVRLWMAIVADFGKTVPEGYAGDPGWAQRLEDVRLDLARMQKEIGAGEWRPAFLSCAHACSWIAMMHEANGVTLPIDTMTVLRKKTGLLKGLAASKKPERARAMVKEVLAARDAVLLVPPPEGVNRAAYLEALPALSKATDAVADAARDGGDLGKATAGLSAIVERVYELAI